MGNTQNHKNVSAVSSKWRFMSSMAVALLITVSLLLLMTRLIASPAERVINTEAVVEVTPSYHEPKKQPPTTQEALPPIIDPPLIGTGLHVKPMDNERETLIPVEVAVLGVDSLEFPMVLASANFTQAIDSDAVAMYVSRPDYPIKAAQQGIEGWVLLSFDIDKDGSTLNAKVIDAQPKRMFNASALKAFKRWKFKPAMERGVPVKSYNKRYKLEFTMGEE